MKRTLHLFLCTLFLFVFAHGVEMPTGISFTDFTSGDIVIGSSGVSTFNIDPPTGGSGYPYTYFQGYQYYSGSSTTFNSSTSFTDGYAVYPSSTQINFSSRLYNPVDNITVYANTPFYFWVDMFITTDGSTPIAASLLSNLNFGMANRNVRTDNSSTNVTWVSLAPSDILSYDATTGHLTGYLFFSDGLLVDISVAAGAASSDASFFIGVKGGAGYQYKISNVIFMAEPEDFTPPGAGGGGDEPAAPTFEEQVLQDLDNIQANQQTTNQVIQDSVSGAVSDINSKYEAAVNPDLTDSMSQAKDGFEQIEQFEESLFEDMAQYESAVDPAQLVFDGSIVNALGFVSHLWVDCFDQLGIWQPIITFPMFFGLALLVIGRGYQAQVSTRIRVQRRAYLNELNAANARRAAQMERMGK